MRGLLDVYNQFVNWRADRWGHRQLPTEVQGEGPRFQDYYDPLADPIAAIVHSAMGAGAAVLFGTTGQISGGYAAIVVGMSAPMLLTQLGGTQSVSEAVAGGTQALDSSEAATPQAVQGVVQREAMRSTGQTHSRATADSRQVVGEEGTP